MAHISETNRHIMSNGNIIIQIPNISN